MKVSLILVFINVSIFLILDIISISLALFEVSDITEYLYLIRSNTIRLGGNNNTLVLQQGEYYRLFTSIFLHVNFVHLAVNMFSLWQVGSFLEDGMSKIKFLTLYFLSGLGGSIFSVLFQEGVLSVGASGAIFGLIGALLSWSVLKKQWEITKIVMLNLILNLFITLSVPGIDNMAHLGGFLTGLILGLAFFTTGPKVVLVKK